MFIMCQIGQLLEKGYDVNLKYSCLIIKQDHGYPISEVRMSKYRMFALNIAHDLPKCLNVVINDKNWLWHMRLGHLHFKGLKLLLKENMLKRLLYLVHPNEVCECRIIGKNARTNFAKETSPL